MMVVLVSLRRLLAVAVAVCLLHSVVWAQARNQVASSAGCEIRKVAGGKMLGCCSVTLPDVLYEIYKLGGDLVKVAVHTCIPSAITGLNKSCFQNNIKLRTLWITSCGIEKIEPGAFEVLGKLTSLDLYGNKISMIGKGTFTGLTNLLVLRLGENQIELGLLIRYTFDYLENMAGLDISYQDMALFPLLDMFFLHGLTNLLQLNLSGNNMVNLERERASWFFVNQEETLTVLDLSSTHLTNDMLPMLKNFKRLKKLFLQENDLGYVLDGSLPKLTRNGYLCLSYNRIMFIDEKAFSDFDGKLDITGNSFSCDCKLLGFTKWLRNDHVVVKVDASDLLCSGPVSLHGTKLIDYNPNWWQCSPYIPLIALVAVISFAVPLAFVTVVVSCNWVNFKHWLLERRAAAKAEVEAEQQAAATERSALVPPGRL